jgi:protein-disulfide isomerase
LSGCKLGLPEGPEALEGQAVITGRVTDVATSNNVTNVSIQIRGAESLNILSTTGYYAMSGLVPGAYSVTVVPPSGYEVAPNTIGTAPVQIVGSETKTVNFVLRRIASTTSEPPQARD